MQLEPVQRADQGTQGEVRIIPGQVEQLQDADPFLLARPARFLLNTVPYCPEHRRQGRQPDRHRQTVPQSFQPTADAAYRPGLVHSPRRVSGQGTDLLSALRGSVGPQGLSSREQTNV